MKLPLRRPGDEPAAEEKLQLAVFTVGEQAYALDIMQIREVIRPLPITRVPRTPPFIEGVIELRGAVLPVVDMRRRFDLPPSPPTRSTKYLVVAVPGTATAAGPAARWLVALLVDGAREVVRLAPSSVRTAPAMAWAPEVRYFSGVFQHRDRLVLVVDLPALLSPVERATLDRLGGALPGPHSEGRGA